MATETSVETWRPQRFGRRSAAHVEDPLVEPVWDGVRVLAHASPDTTRFIEQDGASRPWPDVARHMVDALRAGSAVFDGYLTPRVDPTETDALPVRVSEQPRVRDMGRRLFGFGNDRKRQELEAVRAVERPRRLPDDAAIEFVAVDLVSVDGEPLLDVPLLERKRILDGVLVDAPLIRRGMHVRPPIGMWVATWKGLGFRAIAYKGANSRYVPGEPNDDWALAAIPVR